MTIKAETRRQAIQLYKQGKSWFSVCFTCNMTQGSLYKFLKEEQVTLQSDPAFYPITDPNRKGLAEMLADLENDEAACGKVVDDWGVPLI